ncbi:MAG: nucleoside recognition protein [Bacillota bacterium]
MPVHRDLLRRGIVKGLKTTWMLIKIIVPVTLVVVTLDQLNLLMPLATRFAPLMAPLHLPGEASLALLLGFFINIYAAIGVITVLPLTAREITVLAVMILTSHSLMMEGPILRFTGLSPVINTLLRIATALLFGLIVNLAYTIFGG